MEQDTKVIVIGAGPAGLRAAEVLSSNDVDFSLFAKESDPCVDKVCGGFIPARALTEFGIGKIEGAYDITALRMRFPGMEPVLVEFNRSIGLNATRGDLGKSMLNAIRDRDSVRMNSKVEKIKEGSDGVEVSYSNSEGKGTINAEVLIDASGANPVSIRYGLVRERIPNDQMGYAIQYHLELSEEERPFDPVNDFYYGSEYSPGGYAWVFPRSRIAVAGTGGIVNRVRENEMRLPEYMDKFLQDVESIPSSLKGMKIIKKEAALMPLAGRVKPSFSERILLAGDAAGHCSPISGEGIHYSMIGGSLAAQTAIHALREKRVNRKSLSRYEKQWLDAMGSDLKWGAWLQKRFTKGGSSSLGSSFLDSEKSQRVIAEMLIGERSVRSAITKAAPGYLKSKIGF